MSNNTGWRESAKSAVGTCPVCGQVPDWFNNVPLTAYCYGGDGERHPEASRIVPGKAQPYGRMGGTRWKVAK